MAKETYIYIFTIYSIFNVALSYGDTGCEECENPKSPYCLRVKDNDNFGNAFRSLFNILKNPKGAKVDSEQLKTLFSIENDPCKRGPTTLKDGVLTNTGLNCILTSNIKIPNIASPIQVSILVPKNLSTKAVIKTESIDFVLSHPFPILDFKDSDLNADWGGPLKHIELTNDYANLQIPMGCIRYSF